MLLLADKWKDYELIDMGNGEKLERWGDIVLRRPDPQVMWPIPNESGLWKNPHGHYHRSNRGGGQWEHKKKYPEQWTISYKDLKFHIKPTGFKHTGLFPEQAANWDWAMDKIENAKSSPMQDLFCTRSRWCWNTAAPFYLFLVNIASMPYPQYKDNDFLF